MSIIFRKDKKVRSNQEPTERAVIGKDVIVDLWVTDDRLAWSLSRVSPNNPRGYRTLRPQDMKECVKAMVALSNVFSSAPMVPVGVQSYCQALADELESVVVRLGEIDTVERNGQTQSMFLTGAR